MSTGQPTSAEELTAVFIELEIDSSIAGDAELAANLEEVCPVDIFTAANGRDESALAGGGDLGVAALDERQRRHVTLLAVGVSSDDAHRLRVVGFL